MNTLSKTLLGAILAGGVLASCSTTNGSSFEGTYLDCDNHEPNLFISSREDGRYDVHIGIYRLTDLDDGVGTLSGKGLSFTATDANGNPIGGIISVVGDTATVTFTESTWPLLEGGTSFKYARQSREDAVLYRVRTIYGAVAADPSDTGALSREYCSSEWNDLLSKVDESDSRHPGEIGFFDSNYWVQGQDWEDISISDLVLERITDGNASVSFTLHNLGFKTPMKLVLVWENGEWLIDNFISLGENHYDWKVAIKEYLKDN